MHRHFSGGGFHSDFFAASAHNSQTYKPSESYFYSLLMCVLMILFCSVFGTAAGYLIGWMLKSARLRRITTALVSPVAGAVWALATGFLGGFGGMFVL